MKKAVYCQAENVSLTLVVVKENKDGTVDLARSEDAEPIVTRCPVSKDLQVGHATLEPEAKAEPPAKKPAK